MIDGVPVAPPGVRRAIRTEAAVARVPGDTDAILDDMIARFPMPERPTVRSENRRALQDEVRRRLRRKR